MWLYVSILWQPQCCQVLVQHHNLVDKAQNANDFCAMLLGMHGSVLQLSFS
jgi:hypothetical protein